MKFKQGIPATELRPFSVEDPTGTRPRAPSGGTKTRARSAARAPTAARAPSPARAPSLPRNNGAPRTPILRHGKAVESGVQPAASSGKEKKTGWLTLMIIVGLMAVGLQTAVPLLSRLYNQSQLKEEGELAHARIISVTQTNVTINDDRVYDIEAELRLPNHQPFKASVEQSFSALQVGLLRPDSWVEIRFNPESTSEFVITKAAIVAPAAEPAVVAEATEPQTAPVPVEASTEPKEMPTAELGASGVATQESDTASLGCAQARACCLILAPNNRGCDAYLNPHIPEDSCRSALDAYAKAATSSGKSCQGF